MGVPVSNVIPIFVESGYACHEVVQFVQANKMEVEIVDLARYKHTHQYHSSTTHSNTSSSHGINLGSRTPTLPIGTYT